MAESYREIVLALPREDALALSDALLDAGALSASLEDADAGTPAEDPLFDEPGHNPAPDRALGWQRSRVIALVAASDDPAQIVEAARLAAGLSALPDFSVRAVEDADWVRLTQSQFEPIEITERLWIVPSWSALPPTADTGAVVITLDPGLAFGTGSHPTTRLCLTWLAANVKRGARVIDYGSGSGILAIAAEKLGASEVVGVDIDPQAVRAAQENARTNACAAQFVRVDEFREFRAEIVVANILSNPLRLLAPALARLVTGGGALVLSGILERQAEDVIESYRPYLDLGVWARDSGWVCLSGTMAA